MYFQVRQRAQTVKYMSCKHEDLGSHPQHPGKAEHSDSPEIPKCRSIQKLCLKVSVGSLKENVTQTTYIHICISMFRWLCSCAAGSTEISFGDFRNCQRGSLQPTKWWGQNLKGESTLHFALQLTTKEEKRNIAFHCWDWTSERLTWPRPHC